MFLNNYLNLLNNTYNSLLHYFCFYSHLVFIILLLNIKTSFLLYIFLYI